VEQSIFKTDAEIATLGSVIMDKNVIEPLQDILQADDFYSTKHQKIFSTMVDLHSKGISIDIITLSNELKSKGCFEEVGGFGYLTYLVDLTPSSSNHEHYAKIVKEFSNKRKLSEKLTGILSDIKDKNIDYATAAAQIEKIDIEYSGKSNLVPISARDLGEDYEPVESLWGEILYPASITQLNSEPAVGKTTFFYNLCLNGVLGNDFLDLPFPKKLKILLARQT